MKWRHFALTALVLFAVAGQGVNCQTPAEAFSGGEYRFPLAASPTTLDPARTADVYSITIIQQIFDGLVQFDENLNVVPGLARSWQVSRDGLRYTFDLREGVRFHNGRRVGATDFVYSFTRILDPEVRSNAAGLFSRVVGARAFQQGDDSAVSGLRAIGPHELEIRLTEPYPPFLTILAMKSAKVVPREEVEKPGSSFGRDPVGTGPFQFVEWQPDTKIVLTANKDYFEEPPRLSGVVYPLYPGVQSDRMLKDFLEGRLESLTVDSPDHRSILEKKGYPLLRKPAMSLLFYGINCDRKPLNDKRVRKALNLAIRRDGIISLMRTHMVARGIIPPGMPGYNPDQEGYPFDIGGGRALLAEAGYPGGEGVPSLRFLSASRSDIARKELDMVKANLEAIGMSIQVYFETDWTAFEEALINREFDLFRFMISSDIPDPEDSVLALFTSASPYNFFSYNNQEFDQLMEKTKREVDPLERAALFRKLEAIVMDDCPIIPILHPVFEGAFQPYVRGVGLNALGSQYIPMKKIWFEE
jgi:peptide/nickel transport system substrate-binding protein/oligopeptide transport system substrate-binding protein